MKAVFFDRDDTLIKDIPYNGNPDTVALMPGAQDACRTLKKLGYKLFIISNQSGVGRGLITKKQVDAVNRRTLDLIGRELFTAVYCCFDLPGHPGEGCRKPSPKMILQAAKEHDLDLAKSVMIGDKLSDIRAGKNAGCFAIYYNSRRDADELTLAHAEADYVTDRLADAVAWIKRLF